MKARLTILSLVLFSSSLCSFSQNSRNSLQFEFYGTIVSFPFNESAFVDYTETQSEVSINAFLEQINNDSYRSIIEILLAYKEKNKLDDWLYYQLIRKAVQQISPKNSNYHRYTLYKYFFLTQSGYDALLAICNNQILFYVQCNEDIFNIPYRTINGKQYVCLNYHDYGANIDFVKNKFTLLNLNLVKGQNSFSYKVSNLPEFKATDYQVKDIQFTYYEQNYNFKIKINPEIKTIFANYPVVDYESYFNIPLSKETYHSLIPLLQENIKKMNQKSGVEYLMHFTRYAFLFEADSKIYGTEKRFSPEQTLISDYSDCEDRAALFFYLVKEIYNLPMLVLAYPNHVTIAVQFKNSYGKPVFYNGNAYTICEPTPQNNDVRIGMPLPKLKHTAYQIAYAYAPKK